MLAMPDPVTAFIDPFCAVPTLSSLTCTIAETGPRKPTAAIRGALRRRARSTWQHGPGRRGGIRAGGGVLHLRQRAV
jgi:hypothetical protein